MAVFPANIRARLVASWSGGRLTAASFSPERPAQTECRHEIQK